MIEKLEELIGTLRQRLQQLEIDEMRLSNKLEQIIDARKEMAGAVVGVELSLSQLRRCAPQEQEEKAL